MKMDKQGYYIRTYGRDIYINQNQKDVLYNAMDNGKMYFDIQESRIMMSQIKEVVPSFEYKKTNLYACSKHPENYIPKGKVCGYC